MAPSTITFDDFSGGEFGLIRPDKAPSNTWTGVNCIVNDDGEIGPRPGLRIFPNAGLPANPVRGMGHSSDNISSTFWIAAEMNSAIHTYDEVTSTWIASTANFTATTTDSMQTTARNGQTHIVVANQNLYTLGQSLADLLISPFTARITEDTSFDTATGGSNNGGIAVSRYRDRLYVTNNSGVIYYSAVGTTGFTNLQTITLPSPVTALHWVGESLVIFLDDSSIWEYRGTPSSDSLRRVRNPYGGQQTFTQNQSEALIDGSILFVPVDRDHPAFYRNGTVTALEHLSLFQSERLTTFVGSPQVNFINVVSMNRPDKALILFMNTPASYVNTTDSRALYTHRGAWSFFEWNTLTVGDRIRTYAASDSRHRLLLTDGRGAGIVPLVFEFDMSLQRPGSVLDTTAQPGDNSPTPLNANFTTPQIWSNDGGLFKVVDIKVDFTKYDCGTAETTHFDIDVTVLAHGAEEGVTVQSYTHFDEVNSLADRDGTADRHIVKGVAGGAKRGAGMQVTIAAIRSCTIRAIHVTIEPDSGSFEAQPRS